MNTPINFEIAKLLKEKGFDELSDFWYYSSGELHHNACAWNNLKLADTNYSAPTIAEVVMWLYEKKGNWIEVRDITRSAIVGDRFTAYIDQDSDLKEYESPTEAYLSAIIYILNNLL